MTEQKTAFVLGGYGFIGAACLRALKAEGFRVVGVGRSVAAGRRCDPSIPWLERDIAATGAETWARDLAGADVVVNAAGALQDGARDNLESIHETAIARLIEALSGSDTRFIQISAAGVSDAASTEFLRSKARGDRKIVSSGLDWVVLRPALVIGPHAYGGTALLRACAAVPLIGLQVLPGSPVRTLSLDDLARAVTQAARGEIASRTLAELSEERPRRFADVVGAVRQWQGFADWRITVTVPHPLVRALARLADALGWLGWRSPLRTTTLRVLEDGVAGDPGAWRAAGGAPCSSLEATLEALPATTQDRWFARLYLLLPLAVAVLSLFWIASGLIGFAGREPAQAILAERGFSPALATLAVAGGSALDILLGLAILVRAWARRACFGMAAVSLGYLVCASLWTPDLWSDPLGPLIKVVPGILLALMTAAILEER